MDMADHVTFMYPLQVYLEGKKEVKQIDFHLKMKTIWHQWDVISSWTAILFPRFSFSFVVVWLGFLLFVGVLGFFAPPWLEVFSNLVGRNTLTKMTEVLTSACKWRYYESVGLEMNKSSHLEYM